MGWKMRRERASDAWRYVKDIRKYKNRIDRITIENVSGMAGPITVEFNSGMTVVCGKNGAGKTTLLKAIYFSLQNNPVMHGKHKKAIINADIYINNEILSVDKSHALDDPIVKYIEPSIECSKINTYLSTTDNYDEMLEGVEANVILAKNEHVKNISQIVGKNYSSISVYEIDGVMDDKTIPYIKVCCEGGVEYDNLSMGMGEFVCIYLYWYLNFIGKNKILLIEEFENFISAYSQVRLMDYMAHISSAHGIWTVMSSHSEHVVNKISLDSIRILYLKGNDSKIVVPKYASVYMQALGVSCEKRGAFLVEDKAAQITLRAIINKFDPELLRDKQIVGLRCDSNIEKIVKHYEPHTVDAQSYSLIAVFDADQREKLKDLSGRFVGVSCLPANNKVAPEVELWAALERYGDEISTRLGIADSEDLSLAISSNESDDHHDRLYSVASYFSIPFESLVSNIVNVWCDKNIILMLNFILSLKFARIPTSCEEISDYISSISSSTFFDVFGYECNGDGLYRLVYNGVNVSLEPA
ncbi:AAA family ATPase [Plesiomonas shigelloides]|uniref:ATP-dependent nuclease n=1 Tax=Plesiomonas shigelloides TaxID=703 RepID=UPI0012621DDD|nr:AAA family ATPase [Plesiomonas shigelloides]KAB7689972.1 AAA family ATPase [Plesiomonas shigelloides]